MELNFWNWSNLHRRITIFNILDTYLLADRDCFGSMHLSFITKRCKKKTQSSFLIFSSFVPAEQKTHRSSESVEQQEDAEDQEPEKHEKEEREKGDTWSENTRYTENISTNNIGSTDNISYVCQILGIYFIVKYCLQLLLVFETSRLRRNTKGRRYSEGRKRVSCVGFVQHIYT